MKTYGGHGDVSIAQAGLTKVTSVRIYATAASPEHPDRSRDGWTRKRP
jgi:hypothetical protein